MGITVVPKERDDSSDISMLEIKFQRGEVESPSRFVTKVDINAKDALGADIPLSRTRKLFMYEAVINPETIENVLNKNGYLATFLAPFRKFLGRVDGHDVLRLIYPKFTKDGLSALEGIGESAKNKVFVFLFDLIRELSYDKFAIDGYDIEFSEP